MKRQVNIDKGSDLLLLAYYKRVGLFCKTKDRHELHEFPRTKGAEDKALKEKKSATDYHR